MVLPKNGKPDAERKSAEREHGDREQLGRQQSVTPVPHDGAESSPTSTDHPDETDALMKAIGTTDLDVAKGLYGQLFRASARGDGKYDLEGLLFALGVIKDGKPKDSSDAMLDGQMAMVQMAMARVFGQLARAEDLPRQESLVRALNQLARTYVAQYEARNRSRTGGEQKVTVQNVSVTEGGQAIVGNVTQATHGPAPEQPANTTPAITDARQAPMEIVSVPERVAVPLRAKSKI